MTAPGILSAIFDEISRPSPLYVNGEAKLSLLRIVNKPRPMPTCRVFSVSASADCAINKHPTKTKPIYFTIKSGLVCIAKGVSSGSRLKPCRDDDSVDRNELKQKTYLKTSHLYLRILLAAPTSFPHNKLKLMLNSGPLKFLRLLTGSAKSAIK